MCSLFHLGTVCPFQWITISLGEDAPFLTSCLCYAGFIISGPFQDFIYLVPRALTMTCTIVLLVPYIFLFNGFCVQWALAWAPCHWFLLPGGFCVAAFPCHILRLLVLLMNMVNQTELAYFSFLSFWAFFWGLPFSLFHVNHIQTIHVSILGTWKTKQYTSCYF
jgi:hypothetical protein